MEIPTKAARPDFEVGDIVYYVASGTVILEAMILDTCFYPYDDEPHFKVLVMFNEYARRQRGVIDYLPYDPNLKLRCRISE